MHNILTLISVFKNFNAMKKIALLLFMHLTYTSVHAQIKILHKRIDNLPGQRKDFRIVPDTIYKNLTDSSVSSFRNNARTRTTVILEYGDGSFTDNFNSSHAFAKAEGQTMLTVLTTYYDTIDKPRSSVRLINAVNEPISETAPVNNNLPPGKFIQMYPYSNKTILFDNDLHKLKDTFFAVIPYKNIKGLIAIYYNENNDNYFQSVAGNSYMKIKDMNTEDPEDFLNVPLVRVYQNQEFFYSQAALLARFPGYSSKLDYIRKPEAYRNVMYARIEGTDSAEQNIFLSLKPANAANFLISTDSTTSLLVNFFSDDMLFLSGLSANNYLKTMNQLGYQSTTEQRASLSARDPNLLEVTSPVSCLNINQAEYAGYRFTFYNEGAGTANEIRARFAFNGRIDINTARNIVAKIDTTVYTSPILHDGNTPANNTDPFYYQIVMCPPINSRGLPIMQQCLEVVLKKANLSGTYRLAFNEMWKKNKGTITFNVKTKLTTPFNLPAMARAEMFFNNDPVPVTSTNTKKSCTLEYRIR